MRVRSAARLHNASSNPQGTVADYHVRLCATVSRETVLSWRSRLVDGTLASSVASNVERVLVSMSQLQRGANVIPVPTAFLRRLWTALGAGALSFALTIMQGVIRPDFDARQHAMSAQPRARRLDSGPEFHRVRSRRTHRGLSLASNPRR